MKIANVFLLCLLPILIVQVLVAGTTGKIVGSVTDTRTGEKLISANVVIEGLNTGAATNVDGYYTILNVPPGSYTLRTSLMGYTPARTAGVRVEIDQTTTINFKLSEAAVQAEEVTIIAERPVVQRDISASRANIDAVEVQKLPASTIAAVVGLQAGVQTTGEGQFVIRGGGVDQTAFMINGQSLRDARDNTPYTGISLTSIENVQVQTGGWNAEYGNIRSGLVNVVTKEGDKQKYSLGMLARYSPKKQKHFGDGPYNSNSYWIRPYVDPAVCWTGTLNGAWDDYTQKQYAQFAGGWNTVAQSTLKNNDPAKPETYLDDLTPQAAQRLFIWQHRKVAAITNADYDVDMNLAGPFPFISEQLGNLRFSGSYRQARTMYIFPLTDDAYREYNGQLKITSDVADGMKLAVEGLIGKSTGTNANRGGDPGFFTNASSIVGDGDVRQTSYLEAIIFGSGYFPLTEVLRHMAGARFTHVLSPTTYYTASLHWFRSKYDTYPGATRDSSKRYLFGNGYYVDEAPFGVPYAAVATGIGSRMNMDNAWGYGRDSSVVSTYNFKIDYTTQFDRFNQVQAGLELIYTDNKVNYGINDLLFKSQNVQSSWHTYPKQAAVYLQDKIEFEGMVANLGLRLDYAHAGGNWFSALNPFDLRLGDSRSLELNALLTEPTKKLVTLSPRLGISFPVTENSKIYFNYGHFRSLPTPENLFLIRRLAQAQSVTRLANPNKPFPRTVQYELGYEQNLFDEFLLRVAAYYKDVAFESKLVSYTGASNNTPSYSTYTSNQYRDIRGFEVTATKNRGKWLQGFINYTYDVRTSGFFGLDQYYENPGQQRNYERDNVYQEKPVPQPYGRANLDLFTPEDFGPEVLGQRLLADWRVNLVGSWSSGSYFTWRGSSGDASGSENNLQFTDSYNVNMRLTKNFRFGPANLQFFMDVSNLFNFKQMNDNGWINGTDRDDYLKSLHLPADIAGDPYNRRFGYSNFPGDDKPGEYRDEGVAFVPMVAIDKLSNVVKPASNAIYFDLSTGRYMESDGVAWKQVSPDRLQKVLDDKAYIDMPNLPYFAFLNPRNIFYGLRVSVDF